MPAFMGDLALIVAQAAELKKLMEADDEQVGRVAQLEVALEKNIIELGRAHLEGDLDKKMKNLRTDMYFVSQNATRTQEQNKELARRLEEMEIKYEALEKRFDALAATVAASKQRSPRAEVEPPRRPTPTSVTPSLHRRSQAMQEPLKAL